MKNWFYYFTKLTCWLVFRFRFGLEVVGQEHVPKTGPFIIASNHISFLDPPLVGVACPRRLRFMARADLFGHTLLGLFLRGVRVIPLRRGEADVSAVRAALAALQDGEPVAIFPEGTRQLSGTLGTAKRGVGLLAEAARVPVIPALVQGTRQALPPDARRLYPSKIRVAFGPPIPYTERPVPSLQDHGQAGQAGELTRPDSQQSQGGHAARDRHERLAAAVTEAWRRLEAHPHPHQG